MTPFMQRVRDTRLTTTIRRAAMLVLFALAAGVASTATAADIELVSGEVIQGRITNRSADAITVAHDILGELVIPAEAIRTIDGRALSPAEDQAPTEAKPEDPEPDAPPPSEQPEAPAPEVEPTWKSQLEIGGTSRQGTRDDANVRLSLKTSRTVPGHLLRGDATYRLAAANGRTTQNNFTTGLFSEWKKPDSRWNSFAQGRLDVDEFQAWDQRITASAGLGYRLLEITDTDESGEEFDRLLLIGRLGVGGRQEFGSPNDGLAPEGLLGAELQWTISPKQRFGAASTFYPDFQETGEFRIVSNADWSIDLDHMDGLRLKLGLSHEHQTRTTSGVSKNDLALFATIVLDF